MSENIEKVLKNEEKVELIVKKTAKLHSIADEIKKDVHCCLLKATKMKKNAFWRRNKCRFAVGGIIVVAAVGLFFII
jgi:hypothetical protein